MSIVTDNDLELLIGKRTIHQMRTVLERECGSKAALLLREIGFAAGEALYERFEQWVREHYRVEPARGLDAALLGEALHGFFESVGWGSVTIGELAPQVLTLDAAPWSEAAPGGAQFPSCHFSSGALADFFTRLGGTRAAVMEVECQSRGEARCRFLVGSPDLLTYAYERMTAGMGYREAIS